MGKESEYCYFCTDDSGEVSVHYGQFGFQDKRLPLQDRIDKLSVARYGESPVLVAQGAHGDELLHFLSGSLLSNNFRGIEIRDVSPLAIKMGTHGYIYPISNSRIELGPGEEIVKVSNGKILKVLEKGERPDKSEIGNYGVMRNYNRLFGLSNGHIKNWQDLYMTVNPIVRPFFGVLQRYPYLKNLCLFHMDSEFGHFDRGCGGRDPNLGVRDGTYFHRQIFRNKGDVCDVIFNHAVDELRRVLDRNNFPRCSGDTDLTDNSVNYHADDGVVDLCVVGPNGEMDENDVALEKAALLTGELGFTEIEEVLTIEIPAGLSLRRERLLTDIYTRFALEYFQAKR